MPVAILIEFETLTALFLAVGITTVFGLWFFYERREAILSDSRRIRTTFLCIKCELIYTRPRQRETAPCPRCSFINSRLKF
ncbi:MAG: hypothetical protein LBV54_08490 [Puniceicoccales bacterium]|nr:hypothetical protein [Puniceicoccales bacterium]